MNYYKKIFKKKELRFRILKLLRFVPDKHMICLQYFIKHHRWLNINNPKRYTEKIQWYKLFYRNPLMSICADKYQVREYIQKKGLGYILNDLYGVYKDIESIDFQSLPSKFIIKMNNGSGTNLICKDKTQLSEDTVKKQFQKYLFQTSFSAGREWVYQDIKPSIIVEKYLEDHNNKDRSIDDYKFLCFNGEPRYIAHDVDRATNHKRNIYDIDWNDLSIQTDCDNYSYIAKKPSKLEEMIRIAKVLSEDFPAARVDLYLVNDKIYFGEITFFPWSGYVEFKPDSFDFTLGEEFMLPERNH